MIRFTRSLAAAVTAAGLAAVAVPAGASATSSPQPVACVGVIEDAVVGDVTVPYNERCALRNVIVTGAVTVELDALALTLDGALVVGDVVADGRRMEVRRSVVVGDLTAREASEGLVVAGSSVAGDSRFANVQQELAIGGSGGGLAGNVLGGDLAVNGIYGPAAIGSNVVGGDLVVTRAAAPTAIRRNVVRGALDCSANRVVPTGAGNVAGEKLGQCSGL